MWLIKFVDGVKLDKIRVEKDNIVKKKYEENCFLGEFSENWKEGRECLMLYD